MSKTICNKILVFIVGILYLSLITYNIVHVHQITGTSFANDHDDDQEETVVVSDHEFFIKDTVVVDHSTTAGFNTGANDVNNKEVQGEDEAWIKKEEVIELPKSTRREETKPNVSEQPFTSSFSSSSSLASSYREERNVFQKMLERYQKEAKQCNDIHSDGKQHPSSNKQKDFDTGVPPLPNNGMSDVLKKWLLDGEDQNRGEYPMCELPPTKSCDVDKVSVVLMSHTLDDPKRTRKLMNGIKSLAIRPETAEIILVWNSEKEKLTSSTDYGSAKLLLGWDNDPSHPLRIFYSLENGLENNLLNRYHPMIQPKSNAIMYFDDDGPFFEEGPMKAGFALWKYNSDVQIGSLTRNIRFTSERMDILQKAASDLAAEHYRNNSWQTHIHPYDTDAVQRAMVKVTNNDNNNNDPAYPQFTPLCRKESGDNVEYNFYIFPNYKAHMSLPSGSILHRNYLCFVWHPLFRDIRQYVLDHPTHPDDMTISTLVSHLSGKPLRTFPRQFKKKKRRILTDENELFAESTTLKNDMQQHSESGLSHGTRRRKLLWQQKDWGKMREEAINSILGYFGSVNPGSVGWCAGTEYEKPATGRGNMRFDCDPEFPEPDMIPWMHEGGLGYDECPDK